MKLKIVRRKASAHTAVLGFAVAVALVGFAFGWWARHRMVRNGIRHRVCETGKPSHIGARGCVPATLGVGLLNPLVRCGDSAPKRSKGLGTLLTGLRFLCYAAIVGVVIGVIVNASVVLALYSLPHQMGDNSHMAGVGETFLVIVAAMLATAPLVEWWYNALKRIFRISFDQGEGQS